MISLALNADAAQCVKVKDAFNTSFVFRSCGDGKQMGKNLWEI